MKISVIITAYNHERFIQSALMSALTQTRPADEVIVIDDASTDQTAAIIATTLQEYAEESVISIRNEANLGVTGSVAKATASASGDVIIFMSGDDISAPERIGRCLAYFESHPTTMAIITNAKIIDVESREIGALENGAGARAPTALGLHDMAPGEYFLGGRSSCGAAAAYRAEVFRCFLPLQAGLYAEDDPLAFRAMLLGTCDFLPEKLVFWRRHERNLSHGKRQRRGPEMAEHFRKCEAMIDQMLADAREWATRHSGEKSSGFKHAVSSLHFYKAKWTLWSVAHEKGVRLWAFISALKGLAVNGPRLTAIAREAWKPFCKMLIPFPLQRKIAEFRSCR